MKSHGLLGKLAMTGTCGFLLLAIVIPNLVHAQSNPQPAAHLRFDVASVKVPTDQGVFEAYFVRDSGPHITWTTQLAALIHYAYGMQTWQISGDTLAGRIYAFDVVTDPKTTDDQVRLMFQTLLAERFKMTIHTVDKDMAGMALTVSKDGTKMQEAKDASIPPWPEWLPDEVKRGDPAHEEGKIVDIIEAGGAGPALIVGRRVTIPQLTDCLSRDVQQPVFNLTNLPGEYYFAFEYTPNNDPNIDAPPLTGALKKIGLNLEKHTGPVETIVIDHIEEPTPN